MNAWTLCDRPPSPIEASVERGRKLVGRGGILGWVKELARAAESIDLICHVSRVNPRWIPDPTQAKNKMGGSGVGLNWEQAFVAATGEAVERLSLMPDFHEENPPVTIEGAFDGLGGRAVDPTRFALFRADQYAKPGFPFHPFRRDEAIPWVPGVSLSGEHPVLLPAELVYLDHHTSERLHLYGTSNGVACGLTLEEALRSALYELIERDAVMQTWFTRRHPPRVEVEALTDPTVQEVLKRIRRAGLRLHLLDITTDLEIPCFLAVVEAPSGGVPALAVGAAARLSPGAAARKAVFEAAHTWNWAHQMTEGRETMEKVEDLSSLRLHEFRDHVCLYAQPWMKPRARFLFEGNPAAMPRKEGPARTAAQEVRETVHLLGRHGYEALAAEVTAPIFRDMGYRVVRGLVPELVPLSLGVGHEYLGSPRLPHGDLNPDPHPFP